MTTHDLVPVSRVEFDAMREQNAAMRDALLNAQFTLLDISFRSDDAGTCAQIALAKVCAALALLNADVPEPITSMGEPCYWADVDREFRADLKAGKSI